jgi:hypothetical protein
MPSVATIAANTATYAKSNPTVRKLIVLYIKSCLTASVVYVIGLKLATVLSQSGMMLVGKKALLANISGRVIRFITAIGVSILVDLMVIAMNIEDRPTQIRNRIANTPSTYTGLKLAPNWSPNAIAMSIIMPAWNIDRKVAERTLENIITPLDTGVLRALFRKPKRLSQTTDMPLKAVVNSAVKAIIPTAMKEK